MQHSVVGIAQGLHTRYQHFEWDEKKNEVNIRKHGLDFADAPAVFAGVTFTFEDDRFDYEEQGFITLGMLASKVVVICPYRAG